MRRREFIALVGAATLWPLATRAQEAAKRPIIGLLGAGSASSWGNIASTFEQRLRELGWSDGETVRIEYRWAEGRTERFAEIADEFVHLKVDVIVTGGTLPVVAAKRATSTIPIIFAGVGNPIGAGLVATIARPGGNITGVSNQTPEVAGKRIELLREIAPRLARVAILGNVESFSAAQEMDEAQTAAGTLGLQAVRLEIRRPNDISSSFKALRDRADAIYVVIDPLVGANRDVINALALQERLPTMHGTRDYIAAGGLISYGANLPELFRRAADYTDKVLRGTKPAEIPVEQPTKFELAINLKTAKALGLTVPQTLLVAADEVIE